MSVYQLVKSAFSAQADISIGWIAMKFVSEIHGPQWMTSTNIGDPLQLLLVSRARKKTH